MVYYWNTEDLDRDKDVRKYARIMKNIKKMTATNLMQVQLNTLSATTSYWTSSWW